MAQNAFDEHRRAEIDGLRALAVLAVVFAHGSRFASGPLPSLLAHAGERGVDLFFVISGFCLSYPLLRGLAETGRPLPRVIAFLRRRIARIAPPYYVAIVLFSVLAFTRFGTPAWPFPAAPGAEVLRASGLDAIFLTNGIPLPNPDFWTLGVEMRWYVLFPLLLALFVRSRTLFFALGLALYAFYFSPYGIADAGMLPCFMFGIVAADLAIRRAPWRMWATPVALGALAGALWEQSRTDAVDHGDPLWHVAMFSLVIAVTGTPWLARAFSQPVLVAVGVASYSIYLIHHPVLSAAIAVGVGPLAATALSIGAGFAFWRFIEEPLARRETRARIEWALRFGPALQKPLAIAEEPGPL